MTRKRILDDLCYCRVGRFDHPCFLRRLVRMSGHAAKSEECRQLSIVYEWGKIVRKVYAEIRGSELAVEGKETGGIVQHRCRRGPHVREKQTDVRVAIESIPEICLNGRGRSERRIVGDGITEPVEGRNVAATFFVDTTKGKHGDAAGSPHRPDAFLRHRGKHQPQGIAQQTCNAAGTQNCAEDFQDPKFRHTPCSLCALGCTPSRSLKSRFSRLQRRRRRRQELIARELQPDVVPYLLLYEF